MIKTIAGNLVTEKEMDVFCHQCNCFGRMGAGIAKQIAVKYPEVAKADKENFKALGAYKQFGNILPVECHDGRICVNMYSQFTYGIGVVQTDYEKFEECLRKLRIFLKDHPDKKVGFPYMIGCGLAGGKWDIIEGLLEKFSETVDNEVYIVRLPEERERESFIRDLASARTL